jgi:hypothetical protein
MRCRGTHEQSRLHPNGGDNTAFIDDVVLSAPGGATDLVGHWKLDEASGTVAADSWGNGNTGVLVTGPVWTAGVVNGALSFDRADDTVTVADAANLRLTGDCTIAFWIKKNSESTARCRQATCRIFSTTLSESRCRSPMADAVTLSLSRKKICLLRCRALNIPVRSSSVRSGSA